MTFLLSEFQYMQTISPIWFHAGELYARVEVNMKIKKEKIVRPPHVPILPRETVEIAGRCEMLVTGVLGIDEYSREKIRVNTGDGIIEIVGKGLIMCWAGEKKLMFRGAIETVTFN